MEERGNTIIIIEGAVLKMKKSMLFLLVTMATILTSALISFAGAPASTQVVLKVTMNKLQYTVNGAPMMFDVAPYLDTKANRSMIPMRFIAEAFGATVTWEDATKTQTIQLKGNTFKLTQNVALPDGMGTPVLKNDRFFVPLRYVSQMLGATVDWDDATQTNTITYYTGGITADALEQNIHNAIMSNNKGLSSGTGDFAAEAHVTLKTVTNGSNVTSYLVVLYEEFKMTGNKIEVTAGSSTFVAITFNIDNAGNYRVTEYWTPDVGNRFTPSLQAKFPQDLWNKLNTQLYAKDLTANVMQQAKNHYNYFDAANNTITITNIFNFNISDIKSIDIYNIPIPAAAEKMNVSNSNDIATIFSNISALQIVRKANQQDSVMGGSMTFVFNKIDGSNFIIGYDGATLKSPNNFWYKIVDNSDLYSLWETLKYEIQKVQPGDLPVINP